MTPRVVAVYGATGHTGRFVVDELLRRGFSPVAVARDPAKLAGSVLRERGVGVRAARADDPAALDRAFFDAAAVINCAGPFIDTAEAVGAAAMRSRAHYLDVTAEQQSARTTFERLDGPARAAGVIVMPAMGFYGGLADLLASVATRDWESADCIRIGIALDSWHPTQGTRNTGARNTAPRVIVVDGQLTPMPQPARKTEWDFPEPFGRQAVIELPFAEMILIARHLRVSDVHTHLNEAPLRDLRDPATPPPEAVDDTRRSGQIFLVDVLATRGGSTRRVIARGRDIYAFTAPFVCEAAARILDGGMTSSGAQAPGAIFDAVSYLHALAPDALTLEVLTGTH